jgi:hypothetical protein
MMMEPVSRYRLPPRAHGESVVKHVFHHHPSHPSQTVPEQAIPISKVLSGSFEPVWVILEVA